MTGGLPSGHRAHDGGALGDFDVVAIAGLECMESTRRPTNTGLAVLHHYTPNALPVRRHVCSTAWHKKVLGDLTLHGPESGQSMSTNGYGELSQHGVGEGGGQREFNILYVVISRSDGPVVPGSC